MSSKRKLTTLTYADKGRNKDGKRGRRVAAPRDELEFCPSLGLRDVLFSKNLSSHLEMTLDVVDDATAQKWASSNHGIPTLIEYRGEITAFTVALRPVSESSDGPLSPPSHHSLLRTTPFPLHQPTHSPFVKYPILTQETSSALVPSLGFMGRR
ncbi:hypothetical protein EVAR_88015_1 [Eumeta japonica]|uniref:Uncharacterized protein n=1 Tax=Eumeta variegata TaxID=151549 RepID=A0A4C1VFI7_EUMVA|nr:hypothetical protein EVAR_88015_1 [Eumeta japonica]